MSTRTWLRILKWELFALSAVLMVSGIGAMISTPVPWAIIPAVGVVISGWAGVYVLRTDP